MNKYSSLSKIRRHASLNSTDSGVPARKRSAAALKIQTKRLDMIDKALEENK